MGRGKLIARAIGRVARAARGGRSARNLSGVKELTEAIGRGEKVSYLGRGVGSSSPARFKVVGKDGEWTNSVLVRVPGDRFYAKTRGKTTLIGRDGENLPALRAVARRFRGRVADKPLTTLGFAGAGAVLGAQQFDDLVLDRLEGPLEASERVEAVEELGGRALAAKAMQEARQQAAASQMADGIERLRRARPDIYNMLLAGEELAPGEIPVGGVPRYDLVEQAVLNLLNGQHVRSITAGTRDTGQITFRAPREETPL